VKVAGVRFMDAPTMAKAIYCLSMMRPAGRSLVIDFPSTASTEDMQIFQSALAEVRGALMEVLKGADARKVFGQLGRVKPKLEMRDFNAAVIFWSVRAAFGPDDPQAIDKAVKAVRENLKENGFKPWKLSKIRIRDIAKRHRTRAFKHLQDFAIDVEFPREHFGYGTHAHFNGMRVVTKRELSALEQHLDRKAARPER
jgi:hypothetical protein